MKSPRTHLDYLRDIWDAVLTAEEFVRGMDIQTFISDRKTNFAVVRALEILGEATKHIPKDIRQKYPEVPWRDMAGIRDKLTHEYFGIDLQIVWQTVKERLPVLKPALKQAVTDYDKELFDKLNGK